VKAIIGVVILGIVGLIGLLAMSARPAVRVEPSVKSIGVSTPLKAEATGAHGIRRVTAKVEQNGREYTVFEQNWPSHRMLFWRGKPAPVTVAFEAGKNKAPDLKEGQARLIVEAVSNDFAGKTATVASDVLVVLAPPRVVPDDLQHYINQGGMELVTFTTSGSVADSGVKAGKSTFRSFPLPGKTPEQRFAMFAYPWDLPPDAAPMVYARNQAGTEVTGRFWFKLFPKTFRVRDLEINDAFLEKVVNQIDPTGQLAPGPDLLSRFLKINGELRRKNNQQLADLREKTEPKVLWNGPFLHWGKEESYFADVRNYIYKGKKVDQQVHLGFDLSDVQNAPVKVANDGRVIYAADLGIYGNCAVVDHGYGLQSIYGHMNRFDVKPGDMVKKGQSLGVAGSTGLAGGVHVHFSMQIDGTQVSAREWWDDHWIHDRIMSKLAPQ
jgi:hypothetical protein